MSGDSDSRPGRHVMIDNFAAGATDDELMYLIRQVGIQRMHRLTEIAQNIERTERRERLCPNDSHTAMWHAGGICGRCGDAG